LVAWAKVKYAGIGREEKDNAEGEKSRVITPSGFVCDVYDQNYGAQDSERASS